MPSSQEIIEKLGRFGQGEPDWKLIRIRRMYVHHLSRRLLSLKTDRGRICRPPLLSASSVGGWVFGFQALFEAAKQNPVAFVLLVLPGVELPLDLEAPVHHEGWAQHWELVSGHVELAGLEGGGGNGRTDDENDGQDCAEGTRKIEARIHHGEEWGSGF